MAGIAAALVLLLLYASPSMAVAAGNRIPWLGGSWYLQGADYPWVNYGNDFGGNAWGAYGVHSSGTNATVDADFTKMAAEGIHVTRWFVFTDGRAGITFANGLPTGLDTYVFQDLDAAVQIAAKHNIYLNLVLLDFSFMFNATTVNGVQIGGHANLINTSAGQQALINNVFVPVFQRYGHNAQIISWEVMNEPEWAITEDGALNGNISQPSSLANFQSLTTQVATAIHANTQSYVTVGEASMKWDQQWKGLGLDFYQIHYYDWMQPYPVTNVYAATYASLGLDRPVVLGEFPAGGSATATLQQYLDTWFNNGYAGTWSWSYKGVDGNGVPNVTVMTNWASAHAAAINIAPVTPTVPTVSSLGPNSGPAAGGTSVTITGTNFSAVTAVKFGATAASAYTVNSATQITATSPPGSGTADVTVTAAGGTSAIGAGDKFTYLAGVSLTAGPSPVSPGGLLTATWSGIVSPTSGDWIALYGAGAPDAALVSWRYTGGAASGSVPFSVPAVSPGTYELRLFANSSFTLLATSGPITVQGATLSAGPSPVSPGGSLTATWSGIISPTSGDWIALYSAGAPNSALMSWRYTGGAASGSVAFSVPAVSPGTYELRLFANSSFALLATSGPIVVQGATLSASPSPVSPGGTLAATWSGIVSPTPGDWIALYAAGATNSALLNWRYTGGAASGSVPFSIPAISPGTYELRLFANSSFALLATSGPIVVQGATLSASPNPVSPGGTVTASWSGITSPTSGDWIALYSSGSPDSAVIVWRYSGGTGSGSVPFNIPASLSPGSYQLRLFANSSFARLATATITVA
jgi:hypothetical protein